VHPLKNRKTTKTKPTILIISPPGDLQIGLQALLTTHLDLDVLVTCEGSSSSKALGIFLPDLVILDQDLSLNSGLEIARKIKTSWPDMKTIVFINNGEKKLEYSNLGVERIFSKGLPGPELIKNIKVLLDMK